MIDTLSVQEVDLFANACMLVSYASVGVPAGYPSPWMIY